MHDLSPKVEIRSSKLAKIPGLITDLIVFEAYKFVFDPSYLKQHHNKVPDLNPPPPKKKEKKEKRTNKNNNVFLVPRSFVRACLKDQDCNW